MPTFKNSETSVKRRFSDFLGLNDRLNSKFLHLGRIVPPAPEKSVVGELSLMMVIEVGEVYMYIFCLFSCIFLICTAHKLSQKQYLT